MIKHSYLATAIITLPLAFGGVASAQPAARKPNIVVIMADDVGIWNISAYHRGMMGGSTPNIDRIAKEGALFTDYYAQQSCTAGRAAFITGQTPFRTGLLKVGLPGAKQGPQDSDPTIAELLKPLGYATAQIGKNHLGDRNEYLPTVHGFDEFYGILYHLNAMEEPYQADYPKDPKFHAMFGPRNIVETKATSADDPTTDPRWGRIGKQSIADGGPLPPHPNMDPQLVTPPPGIHHRLVLVALPRVLSQVGHQRNVGRFLRASEQIAHPKTGKPYTDMVYQPMLELLAYLRGNGFKTFIVSGGGIDFMRVFAERVYGVPPEQIVGSSGKLDFELRDGKPVLMKLPELNFNDDKGGKPVGIQMHIGRRPIFAFGNSDGDLQMLQWTTAGSGARFGGLVHHTDAEREWAYDRASSVGRLDKGLDEAKANNWILASMKDDWKHIFGFEGK
jgi:Sulfatase/haloacid dehalogenase-like hydrolase